MPRTKRLLFDEAVYHIVQRSHNGSELFCDNEDCARFKTTIFRYKRCYKFDIYHYCLMPTHFHFLLGCAKGGELPKILQGITQSYAFYYKKKYKHTGYLYQNRYKSFIIDKDSYLLECGRYIEKNPVRAGLTNNPLKYDYSSYALYAKGKRDQLMTPNPLYVTLGKTAKERQEAYIKYVEEERAYEYVIDKTIIRAAGCPQMDRPQS